MISPNNAPTPPPDPYTASLEAFRYQIEQGLNNGSIQSTQNMSAEAVAANMFTQGLEGQRLQIVRDQNEGRITPEEAKRRQNILWEAKMAGYAPTAESRQHASDVANHRLAPQGSTYDILKKQLKVKGWPWEKAGRIEIARKNDPRLVYWIGEVGVSHLVYYKGPTKFVSARRFKHNPPELLRAIQEPTAQYLLPNETPHTFRYAEQRPNQTGPLIHLVGEGRTSIPGGEQRITHRKALLERYQRLYRTEKQGRVIKEHGLLAELDEKTGACVTLYEKELAEYSHDRDRHVKAFKGARDQLERFNATTGLLNVAYSSSVRIEHAARSSINTLSTAINGIVTEASASLDGDERQIVVDAITTLDAAFSNSKWHPDKFDAEAFHQLLPSRSTPFQTERAELVRMALSERILDMAKILAGRGDIAGVKQMLKTFKQARLLPQYAYDAIRITADNTYMLGILTLQKTRTIPEGRAGGSNLSYYAEDAGGNLRENELQPLPPARHRGRDAMYSNVTEAALDLMIDGEVARQMHELWQSQNPTLPNDPAGMQVIASSIHDIQTAKACDTCFHYEANPDAAPENWTRHQIPGTKIRVPMWLERIYRSVRKRP